MDNLEHPITMQPAPVHNEHIEEMRQALEQTMGHALWYLGGMIGLWVLHKFYEEKINRAIAGYFFHKGRDFSLDDPVMVDGKYSRMVRHDKEKTTFYEFTEDAEGRVIFGDRYTVSNEKLKDLKITKQLANHSRPTILRSVNS